MKDWLGLLTFSDSSNNAAVRKMGFEDAE